MNCLHEAGELFTLPVRVYYEDTDAGGVVYHANYLKFMERARTEWLRQRGFEQNTLAEQAGIVFVVAGLDIQYRKPARLNDALLVSVNVTHIGRASILFQQNTYRHCINNSHELLTTANVKVVCVAMGSFRSTSIPPFIKERLQ